MDLNIRKMKKSDLNDLHRLLSDPEVMMYLEPPFTQERTEEFLRTAGMTEDPLIYAVETDGSFIGYVIYHDYDEDSMEMGWVLYPEYWGHGVASLLTEKLMEKASDSGKELVIECAPEQEATIHIAAKYGFERTDTSDGLYVSGIMRIIPCENYHWRRIS